MSRFLAALVCVTVVALASAHDRLRDGHDLRRYVRRVSTSAHIAPAAATGYETTFVQRSHATKYEFKPTAAATGGFHTWLPLVAPVLSPAHGRASGSIRVVDHVLRWAFPARGRWDVHRQSHVSVSVQIFNLSRRHFCENTTAEGQHDHDHEFQASLDEADSGMSPTSNSAPFASAVHRSMPKGLSFEHKVADILAKDLPDAHSWFFAFLCVLFVFYFVISRTSSYFELDPIVDVGASGLLAAPSPYSVGSEENFHAAKGRNCWNFVMLLVTAVNASLCFLFTFVKAESMNVALRVDPSSAHEVYGNGNATIRPISNPGERAFEGGVGCILSVVVAVVVTLSWRGFGSVHIAKGLLSLIAFRGSTLSLFIAGSMEFMVVLLLPAPIDRIHVQHGEPHSRFKVGQQVDLRNVVLMLMVGISEEFAKALAIICGAVFIAGGLAEGNSVRATTCCWKCWRVFFSSPRALMLAAMAAGFGFMTMENTMYLVEVCSSPPIAFDDAADNEDTYWRLRLLRILTIFIRVALNIHPWLVGLTAARISRLAFVAEQRRYPSLGVMELSWALVPAATAHMFYDLLVLTAPGPVALAAPPLWFYCTRYAFQTEWEKFAAIEVVLRQERNRANQWQTGPPITAVQSDGTT